MSNVSPDSESTHFPPMYILYNLDKRSDYLRQGRILRLFGAR
jgi:hypothetical protein